MLRLLLCTLSVLGFAMLASASTKKMTTIPLFNKTSNVFYLTANLEGAGPAEFMLDTGAGFSTIEKKILNRLKKQGKAKFLKKMNGYLADGSHRSIRVYRLSKLRLNDGCVVDEFEAAILPGESKNILGMNVLSRTAPFSVSVQPPSLAVSGC